MAEIIIIVFLTFAVVFVAGSAIRSTNTTVVVERKFGPTNLVIDEETAAVLDANPFVRYIGQYGNKKYYSDYLDKNYAAANSFCRNLGFDLAAIASTEESSYIYRNTIANHYWTSGRGQVVWETGKVAVTLPVVGANPTDFRIRHDSRYGSTANKLIASFANDLGFPLCQVVIVPQ